MLLSKLSDRIPHLNCLFFCIFKLIRQFFIGALELGCLFFWLLEFFCEYFDYKCFLVLLVFIYNSLSLFIDFLILFFDFLLIVLFSDSPVFKLKFELIFLRLFIKLTNPLVISQVWNHTKKSIDIPIDEILSWFQLMSSAVHKFQLRPWHWAE